MKPSSAATWRAKGVSVCPGRAAVDGDEAQTDLVAIRPLGAMVKALHRYDRIESTIFSLG